MDLSHDPPSGSVSQRPTKPKLSLLAVVVVPKKRKAKSWLGLAWILLNEPVGRISHPSEVSDSNLKHTMFAKSDLAMYCTVLYFIGSLVHAAML